MITFESVKDSKNEKTVNYNGLKAIVAWNVIKGVTEEDFVNYISEIIICLSERKPLISVIDYMKPYNLALILNTFFSKKMVEYLRYFIEKQFYEFKTTTVDMILTEIFGRNTKQCSAFNLPIVLGLIKTIEIIIDDEYEKKIKNSDYVKFDTKGNDYNGYYSVCFKDKKAAFSRSYFDKHGIPWFKAIQILTEIILSLKGKLDNKLPLHDYSNQIGSANLIKIMFSLYQDETICYFEYFAEEFTIRRERITASKLISHTIERSEVNHHKFLFGEALKDIKAKIESISISEYSQQCIMFPLSNLNEMTFDKTIWNFYFLKGPALNNISYDFSSIEIDTIRHEYMLYFKDVLHDRSDIPGTGKYSTTIIGISSLLKINPSIIRFCDIRKTDIRQLKTFLQTSVQTKKNAPLSVSTMSRIFLYLGEIVMFLTDYYLSLAKKDQRYNRYVPKQNYFRDFKLANVDKMANNTISIPDVVMDKICKYKDEIGDTYCLMFDIFNWTGLRAKEVEELEEGCVHYEEENDFWYILASSSKTEKAKRKNGISSKRIVAVPQGVAKKILDHEEQTKSLREKYKTQYIFIKESIGFGHEYSIIRSCNMMKSLNNITKKYNITDMTNKQWHFTTRQSRKTFAVKLISNGASVEELATALGHLWVETSAAFYAEIEHMKVADMNIEFFKRKFEITFGKEQLNRFNEQERKNLYIEFCLGFRQVELGFCNRHITQGICDKLECSTCNCLCTGTDYLDQWVNMRDLQQKQLDILLEIYTSKCYENYEEFPEFKYVLNLLKSYQDVIDNITGIGNST